MEKTTAELTRAFHKLYELEQELAFYKIDTKLSPLPPCSIQVTVKHQPYRETWWRQHNAMGRFSASGAENLVRVHGECN